MIFDFIFGRAFFYLLALAIVICAAALILLTLKLDKDLKDEQQQYIDFERETGKYSKAGSKPDGNVPQQGTVH